MYASIPGEANGTGQFCKAFESWKGLQGSILSRRFYIAGRGCSCFLRLPERYHFTAMLNVKDTVSNAEIMAGLYKEGKHWAQGAYGVGTIHDSWA